jgi:hypothetical protein
MVKANQMEDRGTNALKSHMATCEKMEMRQTRRGWLQECFGCEVRILQFQNCCCVVIVEGSVCICDESGCISCLFLSF